VLALLQFDAVSVPLMERLLAEDRLPALAELRRAGTVRPLAAPHWELGDTVFPTLYTGTGPGDHGRYYPFEWSAAKQRVFHMDSMPKATTTWDRLSRAGRRSLVIDPFASWPPRRIRGLCISGWQLKNSYVLRRWSAPRRATYALARELGPPALVEQIMGAPSPSQLRELHRGFVAAPRRAADLAARVMTREYPDLLWVTFGPVHLAGHWLWPAQELAGTGSDLANALSDVYVAADRALGRILESLPSGTDVVLFSPIGMGSNCSRSDLLPDMLEAVLEGRRLRDAPPGSRIWRFRASVPTSWRTGVSRAIPGLALRELVARFYLHRVDWTRTRAFTLPGHIHGLVRLNLRGREREGIVDPADAEALVEEITTGLESFTDPDGAPSVARVERVAEAISGPCADRLPDLVVRWSERPSKDVTFVSSERHGKVVRRGVGSGWTGNHVEGAWIVLPPGGGRLRELGRPPQVVDIAATACALAGADTSGLAGEPLLAAT
jgi:predicted AlkP superfamily phosphohydrolase/phosphomutase